MSVFMQPIYTQTVGTGAPASITFNNIPQGYSDLKIVTSTRDTAAGPFVMTMYVNNDTTPYYGFIRLQGNGTAASTDRAVNGILGYTLAPLESGTAQTSNIFSNGEIYISNYSGGNFKQIMSTSVTENNSAVSYVYFTTGLWSKNNPITSLTIYAGGTGFAQYSTVTIYGIAPQFATQTPIAPTVTSVVDQAGFALVNFLPTAGDTGTIYAVTDNNSNTTYGASSPIVAPLTLGSATTFNAKSINAVGTTAAATTAAITSSNSYASIATLYPSGVGTVTFTNIPQNYTHLQIRINGNLATSGSSIYAYFNGDTTAANYGWHYVTGNGSGAYSGSVLSAGSIKIYGAYVGTNSAGPTVAVTDLLDYTNTNKYKTGRVISGADFNGTGEVGLYSGYWASFAPISSITVGGTANFSANTSIALYGIA